MSQEHKVSQTYLYWMKWLYRLFGFSYLVLFVIYFAYRSAYSLGSRQLGYRIFVLVVEFLASISVCLIVFMKLRNPWESKYVGQADGAYELLEMTRELEDSKIAKKRKAATDEEDDESTELDLFSPSQASCKDEETVVVGAAASDGTVVAQKTKSGKKNESKYTLRVLVPCYKEDLAIVKGTLLAALDMTFDPEKLFVYLCDDGRDPKKQQFIEEEQAKGHKNLYYVTRPDKYKGHGKAGNLNYCLRKVIYRGLAKKDVPKHEIVIIFDADMVAKPEFATRVLQYFKKDRKCVLVQTPQTFHNIPMFADFFDAHNINFFAYTLPAMSAWNATTCCGTNFAISARALARVNWFPTLSITEDMYLAMKILEKGGHVKYHAENLAVGEAPMDLRQIFQQRSRWAKGTIQIALKDNPLNSEGLNWIQKLSFFNAVWSYFTSAFFNPLFVVINALGIVIGLYPVTSLSFTAAMLFVCYYSLFYVMIHFTPLLSRHYLSLWIVGKMGHFFSFMSLKAIVNVIGASFNSKAIDFKVTKKKVAAKNDSENPEDGVDEDSVETQSSYESDGDEDSVESLHDGAAAVDVEGSRDFLGDDVNKVSNEERDSSWKDLRFHGIMTFFIFVVLIYGIYILVDGTPFVPEIDDERSVYQKKGIRVFGISWMFQFFIAYSIPLWYAILPNRFDVHGMFLRVAMTVDFILSASLIFLTVAFFQFPWIPRIPEITALEDFSPAKTSFWIEGSSDLKAMSKYILNTATESKIPVLVFDARPTKNVGLYDNGGSSSYSEYRSFLNAAAKRISDINFPVVVVMEPNWLQESLVSADSTAFGAIPVPEIDPEFQGLIPTEIAGGVDVSAAYKVNFEKIYALADEFKDFMNQLPELSRVYVDAGDPRYLTSLGFYPLYLLKDIFTRSRLRGVALNVADFYDEKSVGIVGKIWWNITNTDPSEMMHFIEDSSRNGGKWTTNNTWTEMQTCRFDPPYLDFGNPAMWQKEAIYKYYEDEVFWPEGKDARLWVKIPGASDGRLYGVGTVKKCLMNHNKACDSVCPEILPGVELGQSPVYSGMCACDQ